MSNPRLPPIPKTDPAVESLKRRRDRFSKEWFDSYDVMEPSQKTKVKRHFLSIVQKKTPGMTLPGIEAQLQLKRKQANRAFSIQQQIARVPRALTEKPKARPSAKASAKPSAYSTAAAFVIPPDVFAECQKIKKEIEEYFSYTRGVEQFPEIDRKYQPKFFEELERLRRRVKEECNLRGQVPDRKEFFQNMNKLLEDMIGEMMKDPRYNGSGGKTRRRGKTRRGKTRRGKTRRRGKRRKTRTSKN